MISDKKSNLEFIEKYFLNGSKLLQSISFSQVLKLVDLINQVRVTKKQLFVAGNGGSAATANHFVTDIGVGSITRSNPVKAISLCDNLATITALSNDLSFDQVFEQQLKLLGCAGDLFLVISASGNSKNLISGTKVAIELGLNVFSLTGFDGGQVKRLTCENNIHIETPIGAYGAVEDAHLSICHVITECIRAR